jgi:hypothetical protein
MFNNYLDFFTSTALLESVAKAPYIPGQLAPLFETRGLVGTQMALEEQPSDGGGVMTATARGTPGASLVLARRKVHTFNTAHYRKDGAVYADEVLNARALGPNAAAELITSRRDRVVAALRRDTDATLENLRMACLLAPSNAFGNMPADKVVAFQTDATKTRAVIMSQIIIPMETALDGVPFSGVRLLCSDGIWDDIIENKGIKDTYLLTAQAAELRGEPLRSFSWGGITFERYRGSSATAITTNKAIAIPEGVPGMFLQGFAPADTLSQVGAGQLGQPYYMQAYPLGDDDRGWRMEMQTNPVMVCTRPTAVFTVAMS